MIGLLNKGMTQCFSDNSAALSKFQNAQKYADIADVALAVILFIGGHFLAYKGLIPSFGNFNPVSAAAIVYLLLTGGLYCYPCCKRVVQKFKKDGWNDTVTAILDKGNTKLGFDKR